MITIYDENNNIIAEINLVNILFGIIAYKFLKNKLKQKTKEE